MTILSQTFKNFRRHFIVWGIIGIALMAPKLFQDTTPIKHDTPSVGSRAFVMDSIDCKPIISGVFPTGVVVRKVGGGHYFTRNTVKIGKALDESMNGPEWSSHDVIQFCR